MATDVTFGVAQVRKNNLLGATVFYRWPPFNLARKEQPPTIVAISAYGNQVTLFSDRSNRSHSVAAIEAIVAIIWELGFCQTVLVVSVRNFVFYYISCNLALHMKEWKKWMIENQH